MDQKHTMKAQSAMEYLMTYGWAIIVVVVVVYALYSFGFFSTVSTTTCQPQAGFRCQGLLYSHTTGNVVATIAQAEQTTWYTTNVIFVQQQASSAPPASYFTASNEQMVTISFGINQPEQMNFPVLNANGIQVGPVNVGTSSSGYVWAQYTTCTGPSCSSPGTGNNPYYYAEIGKALLTAS